MNISKNRVLISVVMITYNHEKYIHKAIEGVLMQQGGFDVEFIIADDHSPDNTEDIVKNIKNTHPKASCIKYTKHPVNKGMTQNFSWALKEATGKYIALCDGDDYWTDPYKLQKQVDFLEANANYIVCSHNTLNLIEDTKELVSQKSEVIEDTVISEDQLKRGFYLQTLSLVFRNITKDLPISKYISSNGDSFLLSYFGKYGKGMILSSIKPGIYRLHSGGLWTSLTSQKDRKLISKYFLFKQLILLHSEDEETKDFYRKKNKRLSRKLISYIPKSSLRNAFLYNKIFVLNHNIITELKHYKKLLKYNLYFLAKK